jgi:DNA-directed RNA polymerase specialized sigma24 family protein
MDTPQPEPCQESLQQAIRKVELAVAGLIRDPHQRDEVLSSLGLRLTRALAKGEQIASYLGFLLKVLPEEVIQLRRKWGRQRKRSAVLGAAGGDEAESEAAAGCDLSEDQVRGLADRLPAPFGQYLADLLAGRSEAEIARRDGVQESAVRKRWSRLRAYFNQRGMLEKILDFLVTKGGSSAPLGMGGESFAPQPPNPPTPQPPNPVIEVAPRARRTRGIHEAAIYRRAGSQQGIASVWLGHSHRSCAHGAAKQQHQLQEGWADQC